MVIEFLALSFVVNLMVTSCVCVFFCLQNYFINNPIIIINVYISIFECINESLNQSNITQIVSQNYSILPLS